jgi:Reverse transcriptase (RNA-dependent DNA polymerase)
MLYPDGTVRKLKARFCVRGDRQLEGVDYFDTFAPVVNWITVRLMLVLSILLDLATKQIDYTAAFVHAPIDRDPYWNNLTAEQQERSGVYITMPRGFTQDGKVLQLKKSLYGLKQSPRNFFKFLKSKLERVGFKSIDDIDSCLFVSPHVICLVYVDDTFFYSPKEEYIDEVILQLREQ